ncbi:mitochondrial 54S ribosomal protein bL28m TDEL_0A06940 [Torulaspora delbrueckii]|uniref:Large ribosomal subunit protein bL28m n=1 Tax=Torulaspora delbrueckii TaxID=4950 RepID=G8ZN32_TORDE|nr:mitochondrial 54S ribosomal protein YmL24/YmL14 [Torulaspora delbrueckii]CCE90026.1 hypothetical protein TDEL_0A06940 [Torulaspora delbrueckii]
MVSSFTSKSFQRAFSSAATTLRQWRLVETRKVAKQPEYHIGDAKPLYIPKRRKEAPDYKYGESNIFKQSNKGLYGASFVQYGNNISESKTKTRRRWLPNVIKKGLWSETLEKKISIKMTAKVLRTISKEGGIDNYLIKDKSARIKELGPTGWKLRYQVMKKMECRNHPPHKDAPLVETPNGDKVKVYYEEIIGGSPLKITVGRRRLMQLLFPLEKLELKADKKELNYKKFVDDHRNASISEIVSKLQQYGLDISTITV